MRPAKIWVISDTHFGHKRILEFEKEFRPYQTIQDHDWDLVQRWNSVVRPQDTVWHLGDVWFGKDGHWPLAECNGLKKLVLGNHDHHSMDLYQTYFARIFGAAVFGRCALTHVPIHPNQLEHRFLKNIHGHMHSKKLDDKRYVNVSCEQIGLTPILLQTAIQRE